MIPALDKTRNRHGILPYTGRCYACGKDIRYEAKRNREARYYCCRACMQRKPPKMALAELHWGKPFADLALEHLNNGRSISSLADMCGVHRQALYVWLRAAGLQQRVIWEKVNSHQERS